MTRPDIDGDRVVYTAEGDLWLGDTKSLRARRLTTDPGDESYARFSPDGRTIAFTASYDGAPNVYVMPVEGGEPKRLTYEAAAAQVMGWTPDGTSVLYRSGSRSPVGGQLMLYTVPVKGGLSRPLAIPRGELGDLGPNNLLAYVPASNEWQAWFRYRAGAADQIWTFDPTTKAFRQLTKEVTTDTTPVWCGPKLYIVSERGGSLNLYGLDPKTGRATVATKYADAPVRYPGADAHRVVFEHGLGLGLFDPATGKTEELAFQMGSERRGTRETRALLSENVREVALGPSGNRLLVQSRGQILSVPAKSGDVRVVERTDGARAINPAYSADGKQVAFVSDRTGEYELYVVPNDGSAPARKVTTGLKAFALKTNWSPDGKNVALTDRTGRLLIVDVASGAVTVVSDDALDTYDGQSREYEWSPDGKAIAFVKSAGVWIPSVYLYEVATKRTVRVSPEGIMAGEPHFDPKGRFLVYSAVENVAFRDDAFTGRVSSVDSMRLNLVLLSPDSPSPFLPKIDEEGAAAAKETPVPPLSLDGLMERTLAVPVPPAETIIGIPVEGRILVLRAPGALSSFDLEKREETPLSAGVGSLQTSPDRKKLLVGRGASYQIVDAGTGPFSPAQGAVGWGAASVAYVPRMEWKQEFGEAWRAVRDFFYSSNLYGLDWTAVRRKYEPQVDRAGSVADLTRVLRDMGAELSVGHFYVSAPRPGPTERMGFLGADLAPVPGKDAFRVEHILQSDVFDLDARSPLVLPGVKVAEGDLLLAINGTPVRRDESPQRLLIGTAGTVVSLRVASADGSNERTVRVRALASETPLRYTDWVESRRRYVLEHGGPKMGYAHLPDMSKGGLAGWYKSQSVNFDKDATIVDARFNGGGYVSTILLSNIATRPLAWFNTRNPGHWARESWGLMGHKALLCNEDNYSDGEYVVELWKKMGLGPVVGKRTGGGEVGSGGGYPLLADLSISVPNYGAFDEKGWIIEGTGATPTVEVDQDPAAVMAGRDPQLDRAIALMKEKIAKEPIYRPQTPPLKVIGKRP